MKKLWIVIMMLLLVDGLATLGFSGVSNARQFRVSVTIPERVVLPADIANVELQPDQTLTLDKTILQEDTLVRNNELTLVQSITVR